jgi:hypothetical protein
LLETERGLGHGEVAEFGLSIRDPFLCNVPANAGGEILRETWSRSMQEAVQVRFATAKTQLLESPAKGWVGEKRPRAVKIGHDQKRRVDAVPPR